MSTLTDRSTVKPGLEEIGTVIYHFQVLDSTNTYALKLLSQLQPKPGTLISADYQTAGRGQMGRAWHSAPGLNLCSSYILYPDLTAQDQFAISMAVALAVRDTVAGFCDSNRVSIKWPNDIYVENKKIAGILIQNSIQGHVVTYCVAGIGLNVNETDFPAELANPTSLRLETASRSDRESSFLAAKSRIVDSLDIQAVQEILLGHLSNRFQQLRRRSAQLSKDYHQALYRLNVLSQFRESNSDKILTGTIVRVDEQGRLIIRWENGVTAAYKHREIEYV